MSRCQKEIYETNQRYCDGRIGPKFESGFTSHIKAAQIERLVSVSVAPKLKRMLAWSSALHYGPTVWLLSDDFRTAPSDLRGSHHPPRIQWRVLALGGFFV